MKFVMKFTKKQIATYLADPFSCPFCGGRSVVSDDIISDHAEALSSIVCRACKRCWTEIWALTTIKPEETNCAACGEFIEDGQDVQITEEGMYVHTSCSQQG